MRDEPFLRPLVIRFRGERGKKRKKDIYKVHPKVHPPPSLSRTSLNVNKRRRKVERRRRKKKREEDVYN